MNHISISLNPYHYSTPCLCYNIKFHPTTEHETIRFLNANHLGLRTDTKT